MKSTGIKAALIALSVIAMTGTTILSAQADSGGEGPGVNSPSHQMPTHGKNTTQYNYQTNGQ